MSGNRALCPSSTCREGSILLGVIRGDGRVAFIEEKLFIDREFVDIAHEGREPEKRFRFANTCVKNGCRQWTGSRCGVIDRLAEADVELPSLDALPDCSIRVDCRWYKQVGGQACGICPYVVTNSLL